MGRWSLGLGVVMTMLVPEGFVNGLLAEGALAQSVIVPDETLGVERSVVVPLDADGFAVDAIGGGAQRGQNLFHSFREFNVSAGRGVYFFSSDAANQNILARVTGGNPSSILGTLGTFGQGNPNLFLINPNGIIFGPNASLNVPGSFTATTADAVGFGSLGIFGTVNPDIPSALLTIEPSTYLFNVAAQRGTITNQSVATQTVLGDPTFGLRVPNDRDLLLLGGDVTFDGGKMVSLGGRIEVGAVTGIGTVESVGGKLSFPEGLERGNIEFSNNAQLYVASTPGGDIAVTARNLRIQNSSFDAGIFSAFGDTSSRSGNVTLDATEEIRIEQSSKIGNDVNSASKGNTGDLNIKAGSLVVTDSQIKTAVFGQGNAGDLYIFVTGSIILNNGSISSFIDFSGIGRSGNVNIQTNSLQLRNSGQLNVDVLGFGDSGDIRINAKDSIVIDGNRSSLSSAVGFRGEGGRGGRGGNIEIGTDSLVVSNGGQLSVVNSGQGESGNIRIDASNQILIDGVVFDDFSKSFRSSRISSFTNGAGKGANIIINSGNTLRITNDGVLDASTFNQGDGGNISILANSLNLLRGGSLKTLTGADGKAGRVVIRAVGQVLISGSGVNGTPSSLTVQFTPSSAAGEIELSSRSLYLDDRGTINSVAPSGNGGNLILDIRDLLLLRHGSQISATAGTANLQSTGNGGNVDINARFVVAIPKENSDITANATQGRGGNVNISSQGVFGLKLQPKLTSFSDITASSEVGLTGNIILATPDNSAIQNSLNQLSNNQIDTNKLLAQTCLIRQDQPEGTFYITGTGGIPNRPNDPALSDYPTNSIQPTTQTAQRPWKLGDPIVEPQGFYQLANGRLVMGRECP